MYDKLSIYLQRILPGLKKIIILNNDFILIIDKFWLEIVIKILKTNLLLLMNGLLDIWVIDNIAKNERFELNYLLVSYKYNIRIIIKINLKDNFGINSVSHIYSSAGWLEREIW